MDKDAFYFPHFSNARNDRKIRRVRKELGIEGYAIYFMILETLRDQEGFKYPVDDIDLLSEEFGTSEQKVRTVINNYQLFNIDEEQNLFSVKFNEYLQPYLDTKERNRISGIKGNLIRHKHITSDQGKLLYNYEILEINDIIKGGGSVAIGSLSGGDSGGDRYKVKESKTKETKEKESKPLKAFSDDVNECYYSVVDLFPDSTLPDTQKKIDNWKDEIRKLIDIDGHTKEVIIYVCKEMRVDNFWSSNFLSIIKLRTKNKEGIKYIDYFIEIIKSKRNGTKDYNNNRTEEEQERLSYMQHKYNL